MTLRRAPIRPVVDGRAAFGTYAGACETIALESLSPGRIRRLVREKGWQRFFVADDRFAVGGAIVDAGVLNVVLVWLLDRQSRQLVVDATRLLPPTTVSRADRPAARPRISASFRDVTVVATENERGFLVAGQIGPVTLDLTLTHDGAGPVTAIYPAAKRSGVTVTQQSTCLSAVGTVDWHGRSHRFDGAAGTLDFTHGMLARKTSWHRAVGTGQADDGTPVGVTLRAGVTDEQPNAIWVGQKRHAVQEATFTVDRSHSTWTVETADGRVDLRLNSAATRSQNRDLGLVGTGYVQPLGTWRGTVDGRSVELLGSGERVHARW